ncbi:glycosyltransferase [Nitratireductor sp. CH_MIT9313-5]|jgi:cellulose synthase/poly-beta-1,6-N-acetylglucosamine synthase-like glycosyltransferase|uniref:glycosyltransferase n=1 Tax=Nitratireductor sp. CH_MIT9313-5 TaxID=3107764 RepID=UPI0030093E31
MKVACEIFGPERVARATTAIIVPACNEADRIGACLDALAALRGGETAVIHVCVNNSVDATAQIVGDRAVGHGLALVLSEVTLPRGGVGRARRLGHLLAMRHSPDARFLLSTDADCQAEPDWLATMTRELESHPAAIGRIDSLDDLPPHLLEKVRAGGELEDSYMRLSLEFSLLLETDMSGALGLNTAGGANLGIRRDTYRAIGGYRALESREDRDLIDRVVQAGLRPVRVPDAIVRASLRPDGRAPGGMADKIAQRIAGADGELDSALAPVDAMWPCLSGRVRQSRKALSREEAARNLPILATHVERLRGLSCRQERLRYLEEIRLPAGQRV